MAQYSKKAQQKVADAIHKMHEGTLRGGGSGKKVTNPKRAIAIGLSEAREVSTNPPGPAKQQKTASKHIASPATAGAKGR